MWQCRVERARNGGGRGGDVVHELDIEIDEGRENDLLCRRGSFVCCGSVTDSVSTLL